MKALYSFLAVLLLSGCATLLSIIGIEPEAPKVTVKQIAVAQVSLQTIKLIVTLEIENKNGFDIQLEGLSYRFKVKELEVAKGDLQQSVAIAKNSNSQVSLPLTIATPALRDLAQTFLTKHEPISARMQAELTIATPLGNYVLPLDEQRQIEWQPTKKD